MSETGKRELKQHRFERYETDQKPFDLVELTLRDLERKRAEIDAAIQTILASRPDLRHQQIWRSQARAVRM